MSTADEACSAGSRHRKTSVRTRRGARDSHARSVQRAGAARSGSTSDFVTKTEEQALIAAIDAADLSPFRFHGWTGKRLTVSYGWTYDFDTGHLRRGDPAPDWPVPFRDGAAHFAGLPTDDLVQALLIRYDPGAGIGWHKDRPAFEHVVGLSLGAPAIMRFRRRGGERFERVNVPLEPRGAYHLSGEARHQWKHSIAEMDQTRWSVTFRSLVDQAEQLASPP